LERFASLSDDAKKTFFIKIQKTQLFIFRIALKHGVQKIEQEAEWADRKAGIKPPVSFLMAARKPQSYPCPNSYPVLGVEFRE
jgi:hypothetical protein